MYICFIAYIAIIAFTATQGMRITYNVKFISEPTISVKGCGENAFRCINPHGTAENDWKNTQQCMKKLGITDICWCYHWAEYYADVDGSDARTFGACCQEESGSDYREC